RRATSGVCAARWKQCWDEAAGEVADDRGRRHRRRRRLRDRARRAAAVPDRLGLGRRRRGGVTAVRPPCGRATVRLRPPRAAARSRRRSDPTSRGASARTRCPCSSPVPYPVLASYLLTGCDRQSLPLAGGIVLDLLTE